MGVGSGFLCGHERGMAGRFLAFIQKKRKLQFFPPALGSPSGEPWTLPGLSRALPTTTTPARGLSY